MTERIIYSKYSNDRVEKYCIATDIVEQPERWIVRKRALNHEAVSHVNRMKNAEIELSQLYENSRFFINRIISSGDDYVDLEYIQGKSYENILDEYLERKDVQGLLRAMHEFFDAFNTCNLVPFSNSDEFEDFFGQVNVFQNDLAMPIGNIDMVFQNVIVDEHGKWHVIDYEWTVNCMVPVKFIQYRAILLYVYGLSKRNSLIAMELFKEFGISHSEKAIFEKMEQHFQSVIKEGHKQLGDYYHIMKAPGIHSRTLFQESEKNLIEVYYDEGEGFLETNKRVFSEFPIQIPLYKNLKAIRIDPMSATGFVKVRRILDDKDRNYRFSTNGSKVEEDIFYFAQPDPNIVVEWLYMDANYLIVDMENDMVSESAAELIGKIQKDVANLQQESQKLLTDVKGLQSSIDAIHASLSWKITKPMRFVLSGIYCCIRKFKMTSLAYDGSKYLFRYGIRSTFRRMKELYGRNKSVMSSDDFILSEDEMIRQQNTKFDYIPKVSVLVPLYNTPEDFLREMIESVVNQTYANWELCLADGSDEEHKEVEEICNEYCILDSRIVYKHLNENKGISDNTNACIEIATGDFIGLFDHDDLLTQDALFEVIKSINDDQEVDAVYTDEDKLLYDAKTHSSQYVEPHFKSDFNLDLFRTNNYICHFFVVRKAIVDKVGGFRKEYDGSQDFDFIFRCVEQARKVHHVSKILYHWRIHANSTAANPQSKMYCYEAGKHAIESHLERKGIQATVEMTEHLGFYRVKYPITGNPKVSIIIPNKDEKTTLEKCIRSILTKTSYNNYEIIIVENNSQTKEIFNYYDELLADSRIKVVYWESEFNYSKINNFGVKQSDGEYILLLNNDIEVISKNWMEELLSNCQRKEVGITGAKLIYPDNTVQHAGVIIGLGGIAGHAFAGLDANHPGYFGRAFVQQNLNAVTAACLMVRRTIYDEVGGLEETLKVAFNDVDFCLKVRKAGYLVVMNPNVKLYHYESKSRGAEDTPEKLARFESEVHYMAEHWSDILKEGDPYYNKNLTLIGGNFSVKGKDESVPRYI